MTSTTGSADLQWRDDVPWLVLVGDIDFRVTDLVSDAMLEEYASESGFEVDVARVTFVDSTGISLLLRLRHVTAGPVTLHDAPPAVTKLLELTGLSSVFATAGS